VKVYRSLWARGTRRERQRKLGSYEHDLESISPRER
jgi:hypothetical protein